jgi:hypothetical protein
MLSEKTRRKFFVRFKRLSRLAMPRSRDPKLLFIFGCQRSGTTLLSRIFERDWLATSFPEVSSINRDDKEHRIRLKALSEVKAIVQRRPARLTVLKPLVESQRAIEFLEFFPGSKALWIYRNYRDVAASNIKRFGLQNGIDDMRQLLSGSRENWRSEFVPRSVDETLREHFSASMDPYDAAVLFWYARNSLYFELGLHENPDVMLCKYESLVRSPEVVVPAIYEFAGCRFPGPSIIRQIHSRSVKKGRSIGLTPQIVELANGMLDRLDAQWSAASRMPEPPSKTLQNN